MGERGNEKLLNESSSRKPEKMRGEPRSLVQGRGGTRGPTVKSGPAGGDLGWVSQENVGLRSEVRWADVRPWGRTWGGRMSGLLGEVGVE